MIGFAVYFMGEEQCVGRFEAEEVPALHDHVSITRDGNGYSEEEQGCFEGVVAGRRWVYSSVLIDGMKGPREGSSCKLILRRIRK